MRIMHVITRRQLRGAEIFASQLSAESLRRGHQVIIVGIQKSLTFPHIQGCEYVDFDEQPTMKRFISFQAWRKFNALVSKWKPDIVQANASETLKFTVMSKFLFRWKAPLIYRNANKVSDFIKSPLSRLFNGWLARKVDYVISVSDNSRADFIKTFGITNSKTETIPIGTTTSSDLSSEKVDSPQAGYWINVASLVPEKNHVGLLRIYKVYCEQGGKRHLVIVGDGRLREELAQLSDSLNISPQVHFLGYRQDVSALMKKAVGLLLPSLIEGLPGVILESMICKIPVIAFAVGGIPEIIANGVTGLLIKKSDERAFVQAMKDVDNNEVLRNGIIERAFNLCKTKYSIELIADHFLDVYQHVMKVRS